jgi:hypothetical protein
VVGETLQGARTEADELAAARGAALKKLGGTRPADRSRELRPASPRFSSGAGFGWDVVRAGPSRAVRGGCRGEEAARKTC